MRHRLIRTYIKAFVGPFSCVVVLIALMIAAKPAFADKSSELADICNKGSGDQAIAACTSVIQSAQWSGAHLAQFLCRRGYAYVRTGHYDRAIEDFDRAIQLKPDYADAFYGRGDAYFLLGQKDRAIQDYDQVIRLEPGNAEALGSRGNAYASSGRRARAIQEYDQAIRLKPDSAEAFRSRGQNYLYMHEYTRAVQDYDQAIRLKPDNGFSFYGRAEAYSALGQYASAVQDLGQAIRLRPDLVYRGFLQIRLCRARALWGQQLDLALQDCSALLQSGSDSYILATRGLIYFRMEKFADAIRDCSAALATNAKSVDALYVRGRARLKTGDTVGGESDIAAAKAINPNIVEIYAGYGVKP